MTAKLSTRKVGSTPVSEIGFGTGGYTYEATLPDEERFKALNAAYEEGCTFWDTADAYGDSEDLIGQWFKRTGKRDEIFLATKFGVTFGGKKKITGDPEYVKAAFEKSRQRLGVDIVDLYYMHRADETVPIELTVGAMAELVKEGKVRYLGLSEVASSTLRRAHAVHPISAVQVEYSPFALDIEDEKLGLLKTCRELGATVVAYSPLGRGLLTGQFKSPDDFGKGDLRQQFPRHSKENFPNILKLADSLKAIDEKHGATAGQVALAWLLAQAEDIIPIPSTNRIKHLKENAAAAQIKLTTEEVEQVRDAAAKAGAANGPRYPPHLLEMSFLDTPPLKL
ncbi:Aldo/keto reductase [Amanita muscaria]